MEPLKMELSADKEGPLLEFIGREPTVEEVETLLHMLAARRSRMDPPVPMRGPLEDRKEVSLLPDPVTTLHQEYTGAAILAIRHPGYGWLHVRWSPPLTNTVLGDIARRIQALGRAPSGR